MYPRDIVEYPKVIKFSTDDPKALPVPSTGDHLALHTAYAKVAYLSGAAQYMNSVIREMEETLVASSDGSFAAVLEHAIWTAQRQLDSVQRTASGLVKESESSWRLL